MERNKIEFETKDENGEVLKLCVKKPTDKQKRLGQLVYSKAFKEALGAGLLLRAKLAEYLVEQGIRSDEKMKKQLDLMIKISEDEKKLEDASLSDQEKEKVAMTLREDRRQLLSMRMPEISLDNNTAEAFAQNEQFNYFVSVCTYTQEGVPVFKNLEDYNDKNEFEYAMEAARKFSTLLYDLEDDLEASLPENKYLNSLAKKDAPVEDAVST